MDKPLNPMDKQLIAARFAKARNTYTREARVQQQVAEKMMQLIKEPYTRFRRVVEFGCGTGSYSRILLHTLQPEALLLNDLCREMEECVKELCDGTTVQFVPGDAEAIDFPGETDLITSCSTLQWFNDPGAFFTRCHQALVADGLLAFSTFGATNMHEIRQLTGHGLDYLSVEELQALLSPGFDILHAGHVQYLQQAAQLGDHLIIGVNTDDSVRRLKGQTRPFNHETDRARLLASLRDVDAVALFGEDTPTELIKKIRPDILVKGGDYKKEEVAGREYARAVEILPFKEGYSTTGIVEKIVALVKEGKL